MSISPDDITAVILAGGRGERMGGMDKGMLILHEKPLVQHVIDAIEPHVQEILINANRHLDYYSGFGYPVIEDMFPGFAGPLAGILSSMHHIRTPWMLVAPCDVPGIPVDFVERLVEASERSASGIAVAHDGRRLQSAHLLLPVSLKTELDSWIVSGRRSIKDWLQTHDISLADFSDQPAAFTNINTPDDLDDL
ncbi:MAG: molybdenum cofactor guanylyltransferase MobA [Sedimenticolaceae bacterium]|nr:molybdenum cofactor guanylyltransferase MobA [Sedimenticolaceae bacterium]